MQIRFGQFTHDLDTRQVTRDGSGIHLSPKAFELLTALVLDRPKVLSKVSLQERLWPATFVAEANLSNLIAEIREALGDRARAPIFIRTAHGFGYAFCGEATTLPDTIERLIPATPFKVGTESVIALDPETPRERRFACDDDETRLLRAANPHLRGILGAMLDTCCRPGEILSLQWGDVDMSSRELVVRAEKAKTRRARRLPMSTRLHAVLQMRRTGADGVDFGPEAYVFGDATGQRVTSIRTAWEAARERAGLADLHLADLRHEAASRLEDAGVPTTYVSKFLGHRNLSTTTRYLNATIRGLRLAVEKLEESRRKAARKPKKSAGLANGLQTEGATRSKRDSRSRESSPPKSLTS